MSFGFVSFAFATIGFLVVALANLESLATSRVAKTTRRRTPPPSRD
jgi:hypothetical protein